jgi:hypothetical protein
MQTSGIEHASSIGESSPDEVEVVALVSKYHGEILFESYLIKLSPVVMRVMSDHTKLDS